MTDFKKCDELYKVKTFRTTQYLFSGASLIYR